MRVAHSEKFVCAICAGPCQGPYLHLKNHKVIGADCFTKLVESPASAWSTESLSADPCSFCLKPTSGPAVQTPIGWLCGSCAQLGLEVISENEDFATWPIERLKEALFPTGGLRWRWTVLWRFEEVRRLISERIPSEVPELMDHLVRNLGYNPQHPLSRPIRQMAFKACLVIGKLILPSLLKLCEPTPWQFYANVVMVAGSIAPENKDVRALLNRAAQDPNPEVQRRVLMTICNYELPWARKLIRALSRDPDPSIRELALEVMAMQDRRTKGGAG